METPIKRMQRKPDPPTLFEIALMLLGGTFIGLLVEWLEDSVPAVEEAHWAAKMMLPVLGVIAIAAVTRIVKKQREFEHQYSSDSPPDDQIG